MYSQEYLVRDKQATIHKVFRECLTQKIFTGISLQKTLHLSKPTINKVLHILEYSNLIIKEGLTNGQVGRRAQKYRVNSVPWYSLAIEVDMHQIKLALVNIWGKISYQQNIIAETFNNNNFITIMAKTITYYRSTLPTNINPKIKDCNIAIPGDVSFDRKTINFATNIHLKDISVIPLEELISLPVIVENEANCGVLAECYLSPNLTQTVLYISISEHGVGGGYIVDGSLQKGAYRKGGEIGHMSLVIDGIPCTCGNMGCLERYTSNQALRDQLKEHGFNYADLQEIFADPDNEKIIKQYCHYLGRGLRSLIAILDPQRIVIGGEIAYYHDRIKTYLDEEVFINNHFTENKEITIEFASQKELPPLIGAGLLSFSSYIYDDTIYM